MGTSPGVDERPTLPRRERPAQVMTIRSLSGAQGLLDVVDLVACGEEEAEISVPQKELPKGLTQGNRNREAGDSWNGQGVGLAVDPLQEASAFHRQHQHAGRIG